MIDTEGTYEGKPHLKVSFQREGATNGFNVVVVGNMPIMPLIGAIIRTQIMLILADRLALNYSRSESALIIYWDDELAIYKWQCHPEIPTDSLNAVLETLKLSLTTQHMQQQAAQQQSPILGPNGQPFKRF